MRKFLLPILLVLSLIVAGAIAFTIFNQRTIAKFILATGIPWELWLYGLGFLWVGLFVAALCFCGRKGALLLLGAPTGTFPVLHFFFVFWR
ncbi:MAG TPA: hypothetical protein VMH84_18175 [Xanthobacteraceae bacterium]|nr:hypothetical protein [Xanthobacteraceae bacterium]